MTVASAHPFPNEKVQKVLKDLQASHLSNLPSEYSASTASSLSRKLTEACKLALLDMNLDRYKFIVHTIITENKGEGSRMDCRCFWDSTSDTVVQEVLTLESMVCVMVVFGVSAY
ncbi:MAG: Tctex-1 [Piptocephalis tieghemiana]|nr:MAG: Tctex-1 [Piptocephalis tieghemiana]